MTRARMPAMADAPPIKGYRLIRPLGAGGMGSVYVVEKVATHQQYAVKFLREDHLDNERSVTRFSREIQALRAIRHPHVVSVFDWAAPEPGTVGKPYVVMELLDGEGLDRLLRRRRSLAPALAVSILLQVLDGLKAVHELGIVHRDLGPSNIFLTPQPGGKYLAKVLDFGLARPPESSEEAQANVTQRGTLLGKPAYIAPEMFHHRPAEASADLYACGIILFRMLAGRLPYRETQAEMLWAERYAERERPVERPSIRSFVPLIPDKLEICIAKAVRLNPEERYATADDMQADLLDIEDSVLRKDPAGAMLPLAGSEGPPQPSASGPGAVETPTAGHVPRRRWSWLAVLGIVVGAAAPLAIVLFLATGSDEESRPATKVAVNERPAADGTEDGGRVIPTPEGGGADVLVKQIEIAVPPLTPDAGPTDPPPAMDGGDGTDGADADGADFGDVATVHFSFDQIPRGSRVLVGGNEIDPAVGIDLPRSRVPIGIVITAPRAGLLPYRANFAPNQDRSFRPHFRVAGQGEEDAATIIHGQQGTTFVLDLEEPR
jgi:tRNA A-37 threonylcarbamoyl transferase component Bud32